MTALRGWPIAALVGLAIALASCFDSLITDSCTPEFALRDGRCIALLGDAGAPSDVAPDLGPSVIGDAAVAIGVDAGVDVPPEVAVDAAADGPADAGGDAAADAGGDAVLDAAADAAPDGPADAAPDAAADAAPDAPACLLPRQTCGGACVDTATDANHCGGCGRVCVGVCSAGVCSGSLRGDIIAIGHDYRRSDPTMARVLGNAFALGTTLRVRIARWTGVSARASQSGVTQAIIVAMQSIGRPWTAVTLPALPSPSALVGVDVVLVDAQVGDGQAAQTAGAAWKTALDGFLRRGGVVIVLEGAGGVSYRFAAGAALYRIGAPSDATGQLAIVVNGADVMTQHVASPYLAETSSATLPGAPAPSIATAAGEALVFHITR